VLSRLEGRRHVRQFGSVALELGARDFPADPLPSLGGEAAQEGRAVGLARDQEPAPLSPVTIP
jgi:hypothetical protein